MNKTDCCHVYNGIIVKDRRGGSDEDIVAVSRSLSNGYSLPVKVSRPHWERNWKL